MNYNFIEIGTADFDTVIEHATDNIVGLTIEPIKYYIDKLPLKKNVKKINKGISNKNYKSKVYYISEKNIIKYKLPAFVRGCNTIDNVHPWIINEFNKRNIRDLTDIVSVDDIDVISFNILVTQENIKSIDFLKIDTEGHDCVILENYLECCIETPSLFSKNILFESNQWSKKEDIQQIIQKFKKYGYNVIYSLFDTLLKRDVNCPDIINIILKNKRTHVNIKRLELLQKYCIKLAHTGCSFVECGVANGGCVAIMKYFSINNKIYGFDSFEKMPNLTKEDENDGKYAVGMICCDNGIQSVYDTFKLCNNLSTENINIIKGYFEDTLEKEKENIGKIAILRLDNDWYKSTKYCLETLYDSVIDGGVILIDDYGTFKGCRKAVDEFRLNHNIIDSLISNDLHEYYWIKNNNKLLKL